jgi:hypothetical protein
MKLSCSRSTHPRSATRNRWNGSTRSKSIRNEVDAVFGHYGLAQFCARPEDGGCGKCPWHCRCDRTRVPTRDGVVVATALVETIAVDAPPAGHDLAV